MIAARLAVFAIVATGCGPTEPASASSQCVPDGALADASSGSVETAPALDAEEIDTAPWVDPDPCAPARFERPGRSDCTAVIRLDHTTRAMLGWVMTCDAWGREVTNEDGARAVASAALEVDLASAPVSISEFSWDASHPLMRTFHHESGFATVRSWGARLIVSATTTPSGGATSWSDWRAPLNAPGCVPTLALTNVHALAPPSAPIAKDVALAVANAAWTTPLGAQFPYCAGIDSVRADVLQWTKVTGSAPAEWIVILNAPSDCS